MASTSGALPLEPLVALRTAGGVAVVIGLSLWLGSPSVAASAAFGGFAAAPLPDAGRFAAALRTTGATAAGDVRERRAPDWEPVVWTLPPGDRFQAWNMPIVESFFSYATPAESGNG